MLRGLRSLPVWAVLSVIVSACGGGSESDLTTSPAPSPSSAPAPTPAPTPTPQTSPVPVETASPEPTPTPVPTPTPSPEATPIPQPTPEPTPAPTPDSTPTPAPTPEPSPDPSPEPSTCDRYDSLTIAEAADDGMNDGHGPENTIDDDLTEASRWSSQGDGKALTLTLNDIGEVKRVLSAWYQSSERVSYYDIEASVDGESWNTLVSNGQSASTQWTSDDVSDADARYIRIVGHGNSVNDWNSLIEVDVLGCGDTSPAPAPTPTPEPSPTPTSEPTPEPSPDPTPTPGGNSPIPTSITNSELWDLEGETPHPLVDDYTLKFVPLEARVTTPNGNGWRHEYKIASSQRIAMTDTYEDFQATATVDLSTGGKTIIAQHHAGGTGTIMKLYISDSSESGFDDSVAANGIFDVYVRIRNTSGVEEKKALGTIESGDTFSFRVINNYGLVRVSAFGESLEVEVEDDSDSYFKFGNYLQSQYPQGNVKCGEPGNSDSFAACYDEIGISEATVTMTNVSYERIEFGQSPTPEPTPSATPEPSPSATPVPSPTPAPGTAQYPSDLMDNYNQWKITYPDGVEDKTLYQESNEYFYVNDEGNGIVFFAPIRSSNGTTPNSSYIRSELREREEDGSKDIYWTTDGKHVVYSKQAITHLPIVKSHLVATQIHGNKEEGIDDALVLRLEEDHLFLSFNGGKLRDDLTIKTDYALGTIHEVMFEVIDGKHYVYYSEDGNLASAYANGDASEYLVKDGSNDYVMDLSYGESYFKIGNYTQSNPDREGDYTDVPDNYGEVIVYDFWVDHQP